MAYSVLVKLDSRGSGVRALFGCDGLFRTTVRKQRQLVLGCCEVRESAIQTGEYSREDQNSRVVEFLYTKAMDHHFGREFFQRV